MTQKALRIAFAGTPDFAAQHLSALLNHTQDHWQVVAVYSQPDRPAGRGKKLQASPVKILAQEHNIPVHQPLSLNSADQQGLLKSLQLDVLVVVAYGLLLPQAILDIPRAGCLNVHASLLPRWRGAAPIERAILTGDNETGVSIMQMDAGLDTGDILLTLSTPLSPTDNSLTLTSRLLDLGCQGLLKILEQLHSESPFAPIQQATLEQNGTPGVYASKLKKSEALIDWNRPATELQRQINAFYPRSPAYCFLNNTRIRIIHSHADTEPLKAQPGTIVESSSKGLVISCQHSSLVVTQVQLAGKKASSIADILNGQTKLFSPGTILRSQEL
jgi:methionyl-tRNA formyltransferase